MEGTIQATMVLILVNFYQMQLTNAQQTIRVSSMAVIKLRLLRVDVLQSVNTFSQDESRVYACLHKHKEDFQKATICRTMSDTVNEYVNEMGQ